MKKLLGKENKQLLGASFLEKIISKKSNLRKKEFERHKSKSLQLSVFISLFVWLFVGVLTQNILQSGVIALVVMILLFILLVQAPIAKRRAYSKKVEADLPFFLLKIVTEIKTGKGFLRALADSSKEDSFAGKEFAKVASDMKKGASLAEALASMNERLPNLNIRRANSNLANIYAHGSNASDGLKKLAEELLLKQQIESKEFSGKMVVYALVFIAVSAIVPAMFLSFVLIGSYFMALSFTPIQVLLIGVGLFPAIDASVLMMINSKTPLFLKR